MDSFVSLDNFYRQYVAGLLSKKELEGMVFKSIQNSPRQFGLHRWQKIEFDEYLSWLYPRISRAIDGYRNCGLSFDNYMGGLIHLALKEFRSRQMDRHVAERAAWTAWYSYEYIQEAEPEYCDDEEVAEEAVSEMVKQPDKPRRLLILILKCYRYISDDYLERLAPLSGLSIDTLKKAVERVRNLRDRRDTEIGLLRDRVHAQFYRCLVYEKRLAAMPVTSAIAERMKIRLEKARRRLTNMRQRLAGMRLDPSNTQIADALGIKKSTVDSSMYTLKNRWNNVSKGGILN